MVVPPRNDDSASPDIARRRFQFRLRHLLFLTTGVAVACGLARWLSTEVVFVGPLVCAPVITLIVLTRSNGANFNRALRIGAVPSAIAYGCGFVVLAISRMQLTAPPLIMILGFILVSFLFGFFGYALGMLVSLPFLGLWYGIRKIRRTGGGAEAGKRLDSAP